MGKRPSVRFVLCEVCKARGEAGNYLREDDVEDDHRGRHLVVSRNLYRGEVLYVDCPPSR